MPFEEKLDPDYWASAQAHVAEGFCPDCRNPLTSKTMTIQRDGREEHVAVPECVPCEVEWQPKRLFDGGDGWVRFRRTENILAEYVPRTS
ncbi:hypothetical protein ACQEVF_57780 [Nonomuraea polychroma]|uniref:hypothetical protein n=1 Tax=Nonomuraea polychroma TaxID=46176 RepID=UPI003D8F1BBA